MAGHAVSCWQRSEPCLTVAISLYVVLVFAIMHKFSLCLTMYGIGHTDKNEIYVLFFSENLSTSHYKCL